MEWSLFLLDQVSAVIAVPSALGICLEILSIGYVCRKAFFLSLGQFNKGFQKRLGFSLADQFAMDGRFSSLAASKGSFDVQETR